ncbi:hypothetical protein K470DRAFT_93730 [Piedraia hortae CBS 480.64]|uniref:Uncharacterized protein n=1 Tax=Piedraia hortae CBS 480.64 TaxID=1314780 RepID=A0A6A7BY43_9PEZI|nr:hypothetical protein K470DRAFT_93730 [Piedraia hortae CBS 480.64]
MQTDTQDAMTVDLDEEDQGILSILTDWSTAGSSKLSPTTSISPLTKSTDAQHFPASRRKHVYLADPISEDGVESIASDWSSVLDDEDFIVDKPPTWRRRLSSRLIRLSRKLSIRSRKDSAYDFDEKSALGSSRFRNWRSVSGSRVNTLPLHRDNAEKKATVVRSSTWNGETLKEETKEKSRQSRWMSAVWSKKPTMLVSINPDKKSNCSPTDSEFRANMAAEIARHMEELERSGKLSKTFDLNEKRFLSADGNTTTEHAQKEVSKDYLTLVATFGSSHQAKAMEPKMQPKTHGSWQHLFDHVKQLTSKNSHL